MINISSLNNCHFKSQKSTKQTTHNLTDLLPSLTSEIMSIDENDKLKMSKFRIRMAFFILAYTIRTLNRSHFLLFSMYLIYFDYFWLIFVLFQFFSIKCTVNIWYLVFWILKLRFEYTLILFIQNIHLILTVNCPLFSHLKFYFYLR